jgi:hypothetical protein
VRASRQAANSPGSSFHLICLRVRQYLVLVEDDLVLVLAKSDSGGTQRRLDCRVACARLRLVVTVAKHRVDREFAGQLWDPAARGPMQHMESPAGSLQSSVQLGDRFPDELYPPVLTREQRIEDLGIEAESAIDRTRTFQRVMKRGMVVEPQVAPEPNECSIVGHAFVTASMAASGPSSGNNEP